MPFRDIDINKLLTARQAAKGPDVPASGRAPVCGHRGAAPRDPPRCRNTRRCAVLRRRRPSG
jgi:hypothetical protein